MPEFSWKFTFFSQTQIILGGDGLDGLWEKHHIARFWGDRFMTTRSATPSGSGGDGGCGGLGGLPGNLAVIGLKGASNVALIASAGK